MKTLSICLILLPLFMVGCLEIDTLTKINADGTMQRSLEIKGSTDAIFATSFNIPRADVSLWEVSLDSLSDEDYLYHASRKFESITELNQSFEKNTGPLRFKVKADFNQTQGLFFTRYYYTEKLWVDIPGPELAISDFLSETELKTLILNKTRAGVIDSLEIQRIEDQLDIYLQRRVFEDFANELRMGALRSGNTQAVEIALKTHADSLIAKLSSTMNFDEENSWKTTLSEYFDPQIVDEIHENNTAGFIHFSERWNFFEEVLMNDYKLGIEMPGMIRKTSALDVRGNYMNWEPEPLAFFFGGVMLEGESSVVKPWPLLFTGVLFLLTLIVSVASFVRHRKSSV